MKAKKFIALVAFVLCSSVLSAVAQDDVMTMSKSTVREMERVKQRSIIKDSIVLEKHHSFRIGYGAVVPFYRFLMADPASFGTQSYYRGAEVMSGIAFAEYSYRPLRWLETGLTVGYINLSRQLYDRLSETHIGHHSLNTLSFAAHVRFSYLTRPIVRLYSGLAIGATVGFEQMKLDQTVRNQTNVYLNGSVTLFGVSVGRRLYGFAELAVGSMGIFNFGIGYRFKTN